MPGVVDSPEFGTSVEQKPNELQQLEQDILGRLENLGVDISIEQWRNLVVGISYEDLSTRPEKLQYRLKTLIALVERNGHIKVDRKEFARLGELQKRHVILHEASHRVDWLIANRSLEEVEDLEELIGELPPEQMSAYIKYLDGKFKGDPKRDAVIRQEAMAEMMTQYLESDGSFRGFLEVKSWQGAESAYEIPWAGMPRAEEIMERAGQFDSMTEDEQVAFFDDYPQLTAHFRVYANFRSIFADKDLLTDVTEDWGGDYDDVHVDDLELAHTLPPEIPKISVDAPPKTMPPKQIGIFDLFGLFREDEKVK